MCHVWETEAVINCLQTEQSLTAMTQRKAEKWLRIKLKTFNYTELLITPI